MTTATSRTNSFRQTLWNAALQVGLPTVMWRLPKQNDRHFLTSFLKSPEQVKIDFEEFGPGFAFSPFINPEGKDTYFIKADLHYVFADNSNPESFEEVISPSSVDPGFIELINAQRAGLKPAHTHADKPQEASTTHEDFIAEVNEAIKQIEEGRFQKVVLSRTKKMGIPADFEVVTLFDKLCTAYPTAFVSVVSIPSSGIIWIGASPETLVSQDAEGKFRTMALAGTQSAYDADGHLIKTSEALWRQKEIEEHALVSRYIVNCLKKIRVREFEEDGPKTVIAGNLMHLRMDFTIDTVDINFPQLATVMLDLLHPTSAVCGMPKEPARQFILDNEKYDREFYSGFLGPVNIQQESHIFVNLRTMKLQNGIATLYAGCGITVDSNPEKEWIETELKLQTLGKYLA
ncbi:chorismate-binding protein [Emticicia sp. 21SJ11W-3]|uniref:chorismate-binding protein n=1 Tax=Emticicia sp. 21SJ11W-3 TaxID=2916755 RepID=UPI00209FA805|nr:chorismate-binding protein [Emticicia sp. 21SJ11W-3]UTA69152.1 chorismate-binding protein [Emticicia sp. 21SJ11W-3]